jgi:AcrR family transcriptional regulator
VIATQRPSDARDRLLVAAAQLMHAAAGEPISTRAICDLAGVQAPTLYHHFGTKQGLLDAVVTHGFKQFLSERATRPDPNDPIADIRAGWDTHVRFGLEHPAFYVHIYGHAQPGKPCGVIAGVEAMLLDALKPAARQGRLRVSPAAAAAQILAASVGVTLTLITRPPGIADLGLSDQVRDAVLDALTVDSPLDTQPGADPGEPRHLAGVGVAPAAIALAAAIDDDTPALSPTEAALLREWLGRLSASGSPAR